MSNRKVGHTTTKNTKKKVVKPLPESPLNHNVNPFKDGDAIVGVLCVIEGINNNTPLRFAFPKNRITSPMVSDDFDWIETRRNIMGDIGSLYYAFKNYDKVKDNINGLEQKDIFNQLVEATGAYVTVVCNIDKDKIKSTYQLEDSIGVIFGFTYTDEKSGEYNIQETQQGIHFSDYESWITNTSEFKQQINSKTNLD
jgi:hypothetical protein